MISSFTLAPLPFFFFSFCYGESIIRKRDRLYRQEINTFMPHSLYRRRWAKFISNDELMACCRTYNYSVSIEYLITTRSKLICRYGSCSVRRRPSNWLNYVGYIVRSFKEQHSNYLVASLGILSLGCCCDITQWSPSSVYIDNQTFWVKPFPTAAPLDLIDSVGYFIMHDWEGFSFTILITASI